MSALAEGAPSTLLAMWRKVRQLLPVYLAISDTFSFTPPPCTDITAVDVNDDNVLRIAGWIEEIDAVSQPHHLRTVLQELDVCSSDMCVSTWVQHFVSKPVRGAADRDKIDFLLSHFLRMNLPPSLQEGKPNYAAMKAVLEPVLGSCEADLPEEAREVDELVGIAERCRSLAEFEHSGIIRRGRELKLRAGEEYFTPPFLLAFTHFNAVVRRECSRLMNSDLKFIGDALVRLEQQGIQHIDCTAANWSDREPVSELKNKWATWELANSDYSQDFFANLIAFRSSVEEALERCVELSMTSVSQELRSIHSLLLEMRSQIEELPRKFGQAPVTNKAEQAAPVAAKPVLVWQSNAKPSQPPAVNGGATESQPNSAKPNENRTIALQQQPKPPASAQEKPSPAASGVPAVVTPPVAVSEVRTPAPVIPAVPAAKPKPVVAAETAPVALPPQARPAEAVSKTSPAPPEFPVLAPSEIKEAAPVEKPVITETPQATASSTLQQPVDSSPKVVADTSAPETTPAAAASGAIDLEAGIARLQKTLTGKRPSAVSIAVAGTRILLTAAEAGMFSVNDNRYAKGVQRAVMMRICLVSALETHSKTRDKTSITTLVPTARTERTSIQELISECKAQKLAREEEILSATAKQLSAMLDRAERIAR